MKCHRRQLLSLGATVGVSGCTQYLPRRNERSRSGKDKTAWSTKLGSWPRTSPVVGEDTIYVGTARSEVSSYHLSSGSKERDYVLAGQPSANPKYSDGRLVIPHDTREKNEKKSYIDVIDADTNETVWTRQFESNAIFSPVVHEDVVYVRSSSEYLAIDLENGDTLWEVKANSHFPSINYDLRMNIAPDATEDIVCYPDPDGITVLGTKDGDVLHSQQLEKVWTTPKIHGGNIFFSDVRSGIYAFDSETGQVRWRYPTDTCWTSPLIHDERVYASSGQDIVVLDTESGGKIAETDFPGLSGNIYTRPNIVDDQLISGSTTYSIASINADTGLLGESLSWTVGSGTRANHAVSSCGICYLEGDQLKLHSMDCE